MIESVCRTRSNDDDQGDRLWPSRADAIQSIDLDVDWFVRHDQ